MRAKWVGIAIISLLAAMVTPSVFASIDLTTVNTSWTTVLAGDRFDAGNDQQATASIDLLGNGSYPMFYMEYDDLGTPDTSDDEVAFRFRGDQVVNSKGEYKGYIWIGLDFDLDGSIDSFMVLSGDGTSTGQACTVYDSDGSKANDSPSTTALISSPNYPVTAGFEFHLTPATDNPDIDGDSDPDYIVSYKLTFSALAAALNNTHLSSNGAALSTLNGGLGVDVNTGFTLVAASAQQVQSLNGDLGGYGGNDSSAILFINQGAVSEDISYSDPDPVDPTQTTITASPITVPADGTSTSTITVQAVDSSGNNVSTTNDTVTLSADSSNAVISSVTNNYDGTYTATITNAVAETVTISGTIEGNAITDTASVTFSTTYVNNPPTISGTPETTVAQDSAYSFTPTASDQDNDTLTFSIVNKPSWASFDSSNGTLSGTPSNADVGTTSGIAISVTDGGLSASLSAFDLTVTNINDPGSVVIDNNTPTVGDTLTATVTDIDGISGAINYDWKVDGTTIVSGASNTYLVSQDDVGKVITVQASYTDDGGMDEQPTSDVTSPVGFVSTDDTDGDGINNGIEGYGDTDGDGTPDYLDLDSDNDGIPDSNEGAIDSDGDGVDDYLDLDSDNDGLYDLVESGINDPTTLDTNNDGRIDSGFGNNGLADIVEDSADSGILNYSIADSDGDGYEDFRDLDSDNDGINDVIESGGSDDDNDGYLGTNDESTAVDANGVPSGGPLDALDNDGDLVPNYHDLDSDNDGTYDVIEAGGTDPDGDGYVGDGTEADNVDASGKPAGGGLIPVDTDGDTIADYLDLDSDNDGIPDVTEAGGTDQGDGRIGGTVDDQGVPSGGALPPVDTDNDGIEDRVDLDSDDDGINDIVEAGGTDSVPVGGDGMVDGFIDNNGDGYDDGLASTPLLVPDSDNDGTPDFQDNGDLDNDGVPDDVDMDDDNDGIPDTLEGDGSVDTDQDGVPDSRDLDSDNDGIFDLAESGASNPEQLDTDNDGRIDNTYPVGSNGLADVIESSPESGIVNYNGGTPVDSDGDGVEDFRDLDSDNDGIPDVIENGGSDPDGDGIIGSGVPTVNTDGIASGTGITTIDTDGDGTPNYLDLDSDNDGTPDLVEAGGSDTDGNGIVDNFTDSDGNGYDDGLEATPLPLTDSDNNGVADYVQAVGSSSAGKPIRTGLQGIGGCSMASNAPFDPMLPLLLLMSLIALNRKKILSLVKGGEA